jgi:hypothetical protein
MLRSRVIFFPKFLEQFQATVLQYADKLLSITNFLFLSGLAD